MAEGPRLSFPRVSGAPERPHLTSHIVDQRVIGAGREALCVADSLRVKPSGRQAHILGVFDAIEHHWNCVPLRPDDRPQAMGDKILAAGG